MEFIIFIAFVVLAVLLWNGYVKAKKADSDNAIDSWIPGGPGKIQNNIPWQNSILVLMSLGPMVRSCPKAKFTSKFLMLHQGNQQRSSRSTCAHSGRSHC
jgi:hypothetical protein